MLPRDIRRIMKENQKYADMLEEFDRTDELPTEKIRRSFTLKRMTLNKLRKISKKKGKSMSGIIDSMVENAG